MERRWRPPGDGRQRPVHPWRLLRGRLGAARVGERVPMVVVSVPVDARTRRRVGWRSRDLRLALWVVDKVAGSIALARRRRVWAGRVLVRRRLPLDGRWIIGQALHPVHAAGSAVRARIGGHHGSGRRHLRRHLRAAGSSWLGRWVVRGAVEFEGRHRLGHAVRWRGRHVRPRGIVGGRRAWMRPRVALLLHRSRWALFGEQRLVTPARGWLLWLWLLLLLLLLLLRREGLCLQLLVAQQRRHGHGVASVGRRKRFWRC
jgi:hypothetical protein